MKGSQGKETKYKDMGSSNSGLKGTLANSGLGKDTGSMSSASRGMTIRTAGMTKEGRAGISASGNGDSKKKGMKGTLANSGYSGS